MPTPRFMSQVEFARRWATSLSTLRNWRIREYLILAPNGQVDVKQIEANLRERPRQWRGGSCAGPAEDAATPREAVLAELRAKYPEAPDS